MIFDPLDNIHLRARKIIEKCPNSPSGRWVLPGNELLPEENPYVRFLQLQGNQCRMPALLHSKETLEFLGLDAFLAEKCWVSWTRLQQNQRQTMPAPPTQVQSSYEQSKPAQSSMPALLALVQTQMLDLFASEWNRELSPEERARRLESSNSRTNSNGLPFGPQQVPNGQQANNSGPGNLMMPQQDCTATDWGQFPMATSSDNMGVATNNNNNMTAPFNNDMWATYPDGTIPIPQDQTFGPSNQPTGESVPAANAGPSTLQRNPSSSSDSGYRSRRSSSGSDSDSSVDAGRNGPLSSLAAGLALTTSLEQIPLLGPHSDTTNCDLVNRTFEAQVSRFFGLRPEAAWHAYHVMTNLPLRQYVGLETEMAKMDWAVFWAIFDAILTVDALMAVVVVPRFELLLQTKRISEYRAEKMWPPMAVTAVPRCVDPVVVPASQSGSAPQDPMAAVEQHLQGYIDSLRLQGVNANDCAWITNMNYKHDMSSEWLASPIHRYIDDKNAKEQAEARRRNNGIQSTGDDGDVVVDNPQHERKKLKAEIAWDFLKEVCWQDMPMGNLWDVAHVPDATPPPNLSV
ncbi:uncharacterized protein LTHEOB_5606 [Lasiodiplodia theobromae]|uniref:uncharacterized protein n=1 Tax=Lasiodiplodia theobromae TaxID=45133 RepID=UPI0015C2C9C8|nr:uncharacterized protein LTHEOB_5606 [Lasiodiplodia theobromae]KAF4545195.1 hypothetical protein LTHEOB_5606 [Lasiodiplodia theobromae]